MTKLICQLYSCVFVKMSERTRLRDIAVSTVKTGLGGRYGNKGAILVRLVCDDSSVCFVNCHLAAGQSHRKQRIKDLIEILETKGSFDDGLPTVLEAYVGGGDGAMVNDHDVTILSGDLNFRCALDASSNADDGASMSGATLRSSRPTPTSSSRSCSRISCSRR